MSTAVTIDGVLLTSLKRIESPNGGVLHAMKKSDPGYGGFGEAYFSTVHAGLIKGWKKHRKMTLNLIVPTGAIRFVIHDDRASSKTLGRFMDVTLCDENYCRLTIPPGLWMAFQGKAGTMNMLLNLADLEYDPGEVVSADIGTIQYSWDSQ